MITASILLLFYAFWYLPYIFINWKKLKYKANLPSKVALQEVIDCTMLIPFYNEEKNIKGLLNCLEKLNPKPAELIFLDDYSTDSSRQILEERGFSVISNTEQKGKKSVLKQGVMSAKHNTIVCTDADCSFESNWLGRLYAAHKKEGFTFGVVEYITTGSVFSYYQWMENRALMAIGLGSFFLGYPLMCNGANLMFDKATWEEVGGYENNMKVQGGDDIFLMHAFYRKDKSLVNLSIDSVVYTESKANLLSFMRQRRRWANKTQFYGPLYAKVFPLFTLLLTLGILYSLVTLLLDQMWYPALILLLIKAAIDYFVILSYRLNGANCVSYPMVMQFQLFQMIYPFFLPLFKSDWKKTKENV